MWRRIRLNCWTYFIPICSIACSYYGHEPLCDAQHNTKHYPIYIIWIQMNNKQTNKENYQFIITRTCWHFVYQISINPTFSYPSVNVSFLNIRIYSFDFPFLIGVVFYLLVLEKLWFVWLSYINLYLRNIFYGYITITLQKYRIYPYGTHANNCGIQQVRLKNKGILLFFFFFFF